MDENKITRAVLDKRQTSDDKADINPFDTSPKSEAEAVMANEVQRDCMNLLAELQTTRGYISLQEITDAKWARVHLEGELPAVNGSRHGLFFYTIDGEHGGGGKFDQRLLGGSAIMGSAENRVEAGKLAQEMLMFTIAQANHYAFAQEMGADPTGATLQTPGISLDAGIRKRK